MRFFLFSFSKSRLGHTGVRKMPRANRLLVLSNTIPIVINKIYIIVCLQKFTLLNDGVSESSVYSPTQNFAWWNVCMELTKVTQKSLHLVELPPPPPKKPCTLSKYDRALFVTSFHTTDHLLFRKVLTSFSRTKTPDKCFAFVFNNRPNKEKSIPFVKFLLTAPLTWRKE